MMPSLLAVWPDSFLPQVLQLSTGKCDAVPFPEHNHVKTMRHGSEGSGYIDSYSDFILFCPLCGVGPVHPIPFEILRTPSRHIAGFRASSVSSST